MLLAALLVAPAARADSFEAHAAAASRVRHVDDLVWPLVAACDRGDDVQLRQCRQIRDRRLKALAGATFLVDAEPAAFELGAWDPATKAVAFTLTGCIRCTAVAVEGKSWHVLATAGGAPRVDGAKLRSGTVQGGTRAFADEAAAVAWIKAARAARVELVVKVPDKRRWQAGGKDGVWLELIAYRVVEPCEGGVLLAYPPSGPGAPDKPACGAPAPATAAAGPAEPEVLTGAMVRDAMKPVAEAANLCFVKLNVPGRSRLEMTINADGSIAKYELTGDFARTPTGACIEAAMKTVRFPRSRKPTTKIAFPIVLQ